jgi:FkbM family methyltransferase
MMVRYLWRAFSYRWFRNRQELAALARTIRQGDSVIDVGCHKGGFLFWLRRYAGSSGHVYAFEPQPQLAGYLQRIVAATRWANVTVEPLALSSSMGTTDLVVPAAQGQSSPGASLSATVFAVAHHRVPVTVTTLDAYFAQPHPRITCIKCDCEGYELEVFNGAEHLLARDKPTLLFECEQRHMTGRSPHDVFGHLQARGYRGYFFSPDGLQPVEAFRTEIHQQVREGRYWQAKGYCNNFLFISNGEQGVD